MGLGKYLEMGSNPDIIGEVYIRPVADISSRVISQKTYGLKPLNLSRSRLDLGYSAQTIRVHKTRAARALHLHRNAYPPTVPRGV